MKIGLGFDAHELIENKPLKLGGVLIDFPFGLCGHSDGDVILHAVGDAILGACAAGDIGMYFRDDDKKFEGIDSRQILAFTLETSYKKKLEIINMDIVIIADQPKLNVLYEKIRKSISTICNLQLEQVSIKSKTTEGTLVSRNAMACFAVVLMSDIVHAGKNP